MSSSALVDVLELEFANQTKLSLIQISARHIAISEDLYASKQAHRTYTSSTLERSDMVRTSLQYTTQQAREFAHH